MPPAEDKIEKNIKDIYIRRKDYIVDDSDDTHSHEEKPKKKVGCPNCYGFN